MSLDLNNQLIMTSKDPEPKDSVSLEQLYSEMNQYGYYIIGNITPAHVDLENNNFIQRVSWCSMNKQQENNTQDNGVLIMKLPVPNHQLGLFLNHSLSDLFDMLVAANRLLCDTRYIELMTLDKVTSYFEGNSLLAKKNVQLYSNRMFGSGKNFSKVNDVNLREQLLLLLESNNDSGSYPDQKENPEYIDNYPMIFYSKDDWRKSLLDVKNHEFSLESIENMIDCLDKLDMKDLKCKLINVLLLNPETSELVRFSRFRNYGHSQAIATGFHHQLVKEQMLSHNFENWKDKSQLKLWFLDELQEVKIEFPFSNWYLDQIRGWKYYLIDPLNYDSKCYYKIPTNKEASNLFHKIFTRGLLDFDETGIRKFYSDNLLIGGSAFAYCACLQRYDSDNDERFDNIDAYKDSDIDCPILAGTGNRLSEADFELIVNQKLKLLQDSFPRGWNFRKVKHDKKYKIINDMGMRTLELFQVPYSLKDVWKHYAKYHFGWVRGYFDGFNWHILPSGVISVLSRQSIDIRYCSTKHPPQELIYKYIKRDFYPILNDRELKNIQRYLFNFHQVRWPNRYVNRRRMNCSFGFLDYDK